MSNTSSNPQEVLRSRAVALARSAQGMRREFSLEFLEFTLGNEHYAVEKQSVEEVCRFSELTPLPSTPAFVLGVVNVRGRILAVIDLKKFFEIPETGLTDLHRIIVLSGSGLELGLLADTIVGIRSVAPDNLQPTLPTLTGIRGEYLKGVTADGLVILEASRMLNDPKIIVHQEVEA